MMRKREIYYTCNRLNPRCHPFELVNSLVLKAGHLHCLLVLIIPILLFTVVHPVANPPLHATISSLYKLSISNPLFIGQCFCWQIAIFLKSIGHKRHFCIRLRYDISYHAHLRGPYVPNGVVFECGEGCQSYGDRATNTQIHQARGSDVRQNVMMMMEMSSRRVSFMGLLLEALQPGLVRFGEMCIYVACLSLHYFPLLLAPELVTLSIDSMDGDKSLITFSMFSFPGCICLN